ncbi:hypothetical protein THAOC_15837, partial [Thalassiosira oceanica]
MHPKIASKQVQNLPFGCLRERGDKANDLQTTLDGVRKGAENDDGAVHDVGGGQGPEFEFCAFLRPTRAPRPDELTLSLPRKPQTDFGAETGHAAETYTSPEQVPISISPTDHRQGGEKGDPVEGEFVGVIGAKMAEDEDARRLVEYFVVVSSVPKKNPVSVVVEDTKAAPPPDARVRARRKSRRAHFNIRKYFRPEGNDKHANGSPPAKGVSCANGTVPNASKKISSVSSRSRQTLQAVKSVETNDEDETDLLQSAWDEQPSHDGSDQNVVKDRRHRNSYAESSGGASRALHNVLDDTRGGRRAKQTTYIGNRNGAMHIDSESSTAAERLNCDSTFDGTSRCIDETKTRQRRKMKANKNHHFKTSSGSSKMTEAEVILKSAEVSAENLKKDLRNQFIESKKKFVDGSPGLQNIEKKLSEMKLDTTLSKLKTFKLATLTNVPTMSIQSPTGRDSTEKKAAADDRPVSIDSTLTRMSSPSTDLSEGECSSSSRDRKCPAPVVNLNAASLERRHCRGTFESEGSGNLDASVSSGDEFAAHREQMDELERAPTAEDPELTDALEHCVLEPVITAQYPPKDRPGRPLNPMLAQFCHPQGGDILVVAQYRMPTVHHFVLTDAAGGKMYATCLTAYEEFNPVVHGDISDPTSIEDPISRHSSNRKYYAPRFLCLLSSWPYLSAFRTYLTQLYRMATTTSIMEAPLERYILNIAEEVPAPPPGAFEVKMSILGETIRFWAPPANLPVPWVSMPYGILFECLDIGNILFAWYALACERKLLLVSSQVSLLTICSEIMQSMIFPMRWSHLYIPVIPRFLVQILDAPVPYLCGISRDILPFAVDDISEETIVVDLDRNLITMGMECEDLPFLPNVRKIKLEAALENNAGDVFWKARGLTAAQVEEVRNSGDENLLAKTLGTGDAVWDERICFLDEAFNLAASPDSLSLLHDATSSLEEAAKWDAVQEAFIRFYASVLKNYRKYLPDDSRHSSWRCGDVDDGRRFRSVEFISDQPLDFQPFLEELLATQQVSLLDYACLSHIALTSLVLTRIIETIQFDDFITRRMYNSSDEADIKFFDESIDDKKNRSKLKLSKVKTPFLHSAKARKDMKQIEAIAPNKTLPIGMYLIFLVEIPQACPEAVSFLTTPLSGRKFSNYDAVSGTFSYPTWPEKFDATLFGKPRPIPSIIREYDRRLALKSLLRGERGDERAQPGSNNKSAEVTAFVLFFVTFAKTIGKSMEELEIPHQSVGFEVVKQDEVNPRAHPPWIVGECNGVGAEGSAFGSLHSNFRPHRGDPPEDIALEDDNEQQVGELCHRQDMPKAISPSSFMRTLGFESHNFDRSIERYELEREKARIVAKAQIPRPRVQSESEAVFHTCEETSSELSTSKPARSTRSCQATWTNEAKTTVSFKDSLLRESHQLIEGYQALSSSLSGTKQANKPSRRAGLMAKPGLTKKKHLLVPAYLKPYLDLSHTLLEELYPGLNIDLISDACPKCSQVLSQDHIIQGWTPNDYSTTCPACKHRFVP